MKSQSLVVTGLLSGAVLIAALAGCATNAPTISSHPDPKVAYDGYHSFQMLQPVGFAPRDPAITPSLIREVRDEASRAFTDKGLAKSGAYSDLLILVHGGMQDKLEVREWGLSHGRFRRQDLDTYQEGTLFVDVFDSHTRELIWRGSATAQVSTLPDPAVIKSTLDSIIARYPN